MIRCYLSFLFTFLFVATITGQNFVYQDIISSNDTIFCPPATFDIQGGGNSCLYIVDTIAYSPYSVGGTSPSMSDDSYVGPFNIGFNFDFYCNTYSQFYISSNGWVSFSPQGFNGWNINYTPNVAADILPSTTANVPKNCIMGPWKDWTPNSFGNFIYYQVQGTAPNRRLVISWQSVPMFSCNNLNGTFQIVLHETSNRIENFLTNTPSCNSWQGPNNGWGTHALHNINGTDALIAGGRNANIWTANNEGWEFKPADLVWVFKGDTVGEGSSLTISQNGFMPDTCDYIYAYLDSLNGTIAYDSILVSPFCTSPIFNSIDVLCNGDNTGQVVAQDTNPSSSLPLIFKWYDSNNTLLDSSVSSNYVDTLDMLAAGNYTLEVYESSSCYITTGQVTVNEPPQLNASISNPSKVSCPGTQSCDATATANVFGGVSPYFYAWPSFENTAVADSLCAGINVVTVTDANGCDTTAQVDILVPDSIVTIASQDTTICISNPASIIAASVGGTPPFTYVWTRDSLTGNVVSTNSNDLVFPVKTQEYFVSSTDANGCPGDIDSVTINVRPKLKIELTEIDTICPYDTIDIEATGFGGDSIYTFSWSIGVMGPSITVSPDVSEWYYVTIADACGTPTVNDSVFVQVGGYSPIDAKIRVEDDSICAGENISLIARGDGGFRGPDEYRFKWNRVNWSGSPYQFDSPKKTTQYIVTISDLCLSPAGSDTINVYVGAEEYPDFSPYPSISCSNADVSLVIPEAMEGYTYNWAFGDGEFSNNTKSDTIKHRYDSPGCYDVTLWVRTNFGCQSKQTKPCLVNILESPIASFTSNPYSPNTLDPLVEFFDQSTNANNVQWLIRNTQVSTQEAFSYEFTDTGMYRVDLIAYTAEGCADTATRILHHNAKQTIYIPSSFTPNGDGLNDVFGVFGEEIGQEGYELVIYDRWGNQVFLSKNPLRGWDGSIQEKGMASMGSYPYVLKYIDDDNERQIVTGQIIVYASSNNNSSNN